MELDAAAEQVVVDLAAGLHALLPHRLEDGHRLPRHVARDIDRDHDAVAVGIWSQPVAGHLLEQMLRLGDPAELRAGIQRPVQGHSVGQAPALHQLAEALQDLLRARGLGGARGARPLAVGRAGGADEVGRGADQEDEDVAVLAAGERAAGGERGGRAPGEGGQGAHRPACEGARADRSHGEQRGTFRSRVSDRECRLLCREHDPIRRTGCTRRSRLLETQLRERSWARVA
mmetsp:Transcript_81772/g.221559  ORF Transcript_81772/g.221559 Transcript_81772/m.221559 type:complete len:231 (+) Transcript_81772:506-1198(+)